MLVTKNKLSEAIHAVLNYDNIYVDIQEREYNEEEIKIIALLILLHEENEYFDRSEYDIDYRTISRLEPVSIHSSKTSFMFYLHEDDFSNNELKSLANREIPRTIKHRSYVRSDERSSWRKTNTAYYYKFDKLIDLRDFDSLIVGMFY